MTVQHSTAERHHAPVIDLGHVSTSDTPDNSTEKEGYMPIQSQRWIIACVLVLTGLMVYEFRLAIMAFVSASINFVGLGEPITGIALFVHLCIVTMVGLLTLYAVIFAWLIRRESLTDDERAARRDHHSRGRRRAQRAPRATRTSNPRPRHAAVDTDNRPDVSVAELTAMCDLPGEFTADADAELQRLLTHPADFGAAPRDIADEPTAVIKPTRHAAVGMHRAPLAPHDVNCPAAYPSLAATGPAPFIDACRPGADAPQLRPNAGAMLAGIQQRASHRANHPDATQRSWAYSIS